MTRFRNMEVLYDRYSRSLFFTGLRITGNAFDAEEVMQETFIQYYIYTRKHAVEKTEPWLRSVCIRKAIDVLRSRHRDREWLESGALSAIADESAHTRFPGESADSLPEECLQAEVIRKTMERLPDGYRLVLSLKLFEGYDDAEIAGILNIRESTVRTQYKRGKACLLRLLDKRPSPDR